MTSTRLDRSPAPLELTPPPTHDLTDWRRQAARDYVHAVLDRFRVALPPLGFEVDWDDQPSRHKHYVDTVGIPLPTPFVGLAGTTVGEAASAAAALTGPATLDRQVISDLLGCYGLISRRTELNWNDDSTRKLVATQAVWARPTAAGGGMYPVESYLVSGPDSPFPTGVYHYDTAHHSLNRLASANRLDQLSLATGVAASTYLVASVRYWKNSFKYNSFCYHVTAQDVGCLLASWRLVLAGHGGAMEPRLWFDDHLVARAVDLDEDQEAPYLVVPLGPPPPSSQVPRRDGSPFDRGASRHRVEEKSRRRRTFPLVEKIHSACLVDSAQPPSLATEEQVAVQLPSGPRISLPEATRPCRDLDESLRSRKSSFGLFCRRAGLAMGAVAAVLQATDQLATASTDVAPGLRSVGWTRAWLVAGQVDGLAPGAYCYDRSAAELVVGRTVDLAAMQRLYLLTNYNAAEAGALLVVTGRLRPLIDAYGARGYRMLGTEVGQAAQVIYLAATSVGLGAGAVLGLDNLLIDQLLGLEDTDEQSLLCLFIGAERSPSASYDHALHRRPSPSTLTQGADG